METSRRFVLIPGSLPSSDLKMYFRLELYNLQISPNLLYNTHSLFHTETRVVRDPTVEPTGEKG